MRNLFLAALGVLAVAGVASAQPAPQYQFPTHSPATAAATPIQPVNGATVIRGTGCSNCGPTTTASRGFTMSLGKVTGGNCQLGAPCQSGCGSVKSDLAFHFGSCKNFFAPCGPTLNSRCGVLPFAQPFGQGFACPRPYDSYANH
ncbi:MAG: hypothetical protein FJ304_10810 [Planctomycetes bacterium]|nr:hypothetical protein [Planctomycetota bacterium]